MSMRWDLTNFLIGFGATQPFWGLSYLLMKLKQVV